MRGHSQATERCVAEVTGVRKICDRYANRFGAIVMNDLTGTISAAIPFVKASACGNDFLIIDGLHSLPDLPAFSRSICDRHNGVGADGVEWLFPAQDADIRARLINADGSDAEISGNGTRCVAAYLCSQNQRAELSIRTGAGIKY